MASIGPDTGKPPAEAGGRWLVAYSHTAMAHFTRFFASAPLMSAGVWSYTRCASAAGATPLLMSTASGCARPSKRFSPGLAERLKRALDARHHVVHGVFLWSSNEVGSHTLKRQFGRSDPASFEMGGWSLRALYELVEEIQMIEELIDQDISRFMGLQSAPKSP
jgi:hypothetical protein